MKALLKLIRLEISFLRTSIITIGLILILFTGALLSVISVRIDVPNGMYEMLDRHTYIMYTISDVPLAEASAISDDVVYGAIEGITTGVTVQAGNGRSVNIIPTTIEPWAPFSSNTRGIILQENADFSTLQQDLVDGQFPTKAGEALISVWLKGQLKASVGDTLQFGDNSFVVTGVAECNNYEKISEGVRLPHVSYYLIMDGDTVLDEAFVDFANTREMRASFDKVSAEGKYSVEMLPGYTGYFDNIDLIETFFMAMTYVLSIMIFFILYSLIATFYRQRQVQICRLKLLGASNGKIAFVYCIIAIGLVLIAITVGVGLSIVFNNYFMNLCTRLFDSSFTPHFYAAVPTILLVSMLAFVTLLYGVYQHKIKNRQVAQEVKRE